MSGQTEKDEVCKHSQQSSKERPIRQLASVLIADRLLSIPQFLSMSELYPVHLADKSPLASRDCQLCGLHVRMFVWSGRMQSHVSTIEARRSRFVPGCHRSMRTTPINQAGPRRPEHRCGRHSTTDVEIGNSCRAPHKAPDKGSVSLNGRFSLPRKSSNLHCV